MSERYSSGQLTQDAGMRPMLYIDPQNKTKYLTFIIDSGQKCRGVALNVYFTGCWRWSLVSASLWPTTIWLFYTGEGIYISLPVNTLKFTDITLFQVTFKRCVCVFLSLQETETLQFTGEYTVFAQGNDSDALCSKCANSFHPTFPALKTTFKPKWPEPRTDNIIP